MAFKNYYVKIKKITESKERRTPPFWATLKKFGRLVNPNRLK